MTRRAIDDPVEPARAARLVQPAIRRLVERSGREQGLPPTIEDRAALDKIATLIESAPPLTAEHVEMVRNLLPPGA
jgi:hypothetical protein